ncbi:MAG: NAD(P)/FAD-dependent oxidoreductase [Mariprofundales bacterium]|nr:NAD(P)/FAD-dependent oxidoreductase [Mariprofundales bacterium]
MAESVAVDCLIIGAGAAGLMCAIEAGKRGRKVVVIDHARKPGNKIRMSGGGKCNFTNLDICADHYLSHNRHFMKSALSRFTQWDFINLVQQHQIPYHQRDHGQLFCDNSANAILQMLLKECRQAHITLQLSTTTHTITQCPDGEFDLLSDHHHWRCRSLVIATGGLSIPTCGATPLGYNIAKQFGIKVWPPSASLVPFTLQAEDKMQLAMLAGIAVHATVQCAGKAFSDAVLFTHRGLSGPAILQLSNYWQPGLEMMIDWLPAIDLATTITQLASTHPKQQLKTALHHLLPQRLLAHLLPESLATITLQRIRSSDLQQVEQALKQWCITPSGTEGYRTAEVTRGGVDCDAISSKTMEANVIPGLYFIGEVLDVTGWLGGYNLQWAWSSGWCAGQYI